jgi:alanyl-tRNA synthetase
MGLERTLVTLTGKENVYQTEVFQPIIETIEQLSEKSYKDEENQRAMRIVSDHVRSSVFMLADGIKPANVERGYILRRLLRRAIKEGKTLGIANEFTGKIASVVVAIYKEYYPELAREESVIITEMNAEEKKFRKTLEKGLQKVKDIIAKSRVKEILSGKDAFDLFSTYGFPLEMTKEIAKEHEITVDEEEFRKEFKNHQELSRSVSAGMFKGGLADSGEQSAKLHSATHLLMAALRKVLGEHVFQKGSNITPQRLRLDFSHKEKMTSDQLAEVAKLVNNAISAGYEVKCEEMTLEDAQKAGAMGVFGEKYPDMVKVYSIYDISKEICGGPHVENTEKIGKFKIIKEESSGAGTRRIKAVIE